MSTLIAGLALLLSAGPEDLLQARCVSCHGAEKQKGGLRLDSRASLLKGGDTGPAAVPGEPESSLLLRAARPAGGLRMPPREGSRP
jgi:hypothetical protein